MVDKIPIRVNITRPSSFAQTSDDHQKSATHHPDVEFRQALISTHLILFHLLKNIQFEHGFETKRILPRVKVAGMAQYSIQTRIIRYTLIKKSPLREGAWLSDWTMPERLRRQLPWAWRLRHWRRLYQQLRGLWRQRFRPYSWRQPNQGWWVGEWL